MGGDEPAALLWVSSREREKKVNGRPGGRTVVGKSRNYALPYRLRRTGPLAIRKVKSNTWSKCDMRSKNEETQHRPKRRELLHGSHERSRWSTAGPGGATQRTTTRCVKLDFTTLVVPRSHPCISRRACGMHPGEQICVWVSHCIPNQSDAFHTLHTQ
jgi:hypothetical protein